MTSPAHTRVFNAEEKARIQSVLSQVAKGEISAIEELVGFVEGDPSVCIPLVRVTTAPSTLFGLLRSGNSPAFTQRILHIIQFFVIYGQSRKAYLPFVNSDDGLSCFTWLLTTPSIAQAASGLLCDLLLSEDAEEIRETCICCGIVEAALSHLEQSDPKEGSIIISLCQLLISLHGEHHHIHKEVGGTRCLTICMNLLPQVPNAASAVQVALLIAALVFGDEECGKLLIASPQFLRILHHSVDVTCPWELRAACLSVLLHSCRGSQFAANVQALVEKQPDVPFEWGEFVKAADLVTAIFHSLSIVRHDHLEAGRVQSAVHSVEKMILSSGEQWFPLLRFLLSNSCGAIRTLVLSIANIDELVSASACRLLAFLLEDNAAAIHIFVQLGGVTLLRETLFDYSDTVLTAAFMLMKSLATKSIARDAMKEKGLIVRVTRIVEQLPGRLEELFRESEPVEAAKQTMVAAMKLLEQLCDDEAKTLSVLQSLIAVCNRAAQRDMFHILVPVAMSSIAVVIEGSSYLCNFLVDRPTETGELFVDWACSMMHNFVSSSSPIASQVVSGATQILQSFVRRDIHRQRAAATNTSFLNCLTGMFLKLPKKCRGIVSLWKLLGELSWRNEQVVNVLATHNEGFFVALGVNTLQSSVDEDFNGDEVAAILRFCRSMYTVIDAASVAAASCRFAFHPAAPVDVRDQVIQFLTVVAENNPEMLEDYTALLVFVILWCEEEEGEPQTMLANRCFKLLMTMSAKSVGSLAALGLWSLHKFAGKSSCDDWRWFPLPQPKDADDAHDTLVAVAPLLNGLLHHDPQCRNIAPSVGALDFFLLLLSTMCAELPLRIIGLYGVWNMLSTSTSQSIVNHLLASSAFLDNLTFLLHIAREGQSFETKVEVQEAVYMSAERILLIVRSYTSEFFLFPSSFIAFLGEDCLVTAQARSLLLCLLQDDRVVHALRQLPEICGKIHSGLSQITMESSDQNVVLQARKYCLMLE